MLHLVVLREKLDSTKHPNYRSRCCRHQQYRACQVVEGGHFGIPNGRLGQRLASNGEGGGVSV